jgi:hypothetical protein
MLSALRWRIRRYVWFHGLAASTAWLGVAFWVSLAIDWFFEPPRAVRVAILAVAGLVFVWVLFRLILRRSLVRLTDANMAMLLERKFPQFGDSLLTAVELTARPPDAVDCDPQMLARACRAAAEPIHEVRLSAVFNPRPRRTSLLAAMLLVATVGGFATTCQQAFGTWTRRSLLLADDPWPRKTRLVVEGFDRQTAKVARGADLNVAALADLAMPLVPKSVKVYYRTDDGTGRQATMTREGVVDPAVDRFQRYTYTFRGVLEPIHFDLLGGDARVENLWIEVVDNPVLVETVLDCRYPDYMGRPERTLSATRLMQIPEGTRVTLRAKANKPLVMVQIVSGDRAQDLEDEAIQRLAEIVRRQTDLRRRTTAGDGAAQLAGDLARLAHDVDSLVAEIRIRAGGASGPGDRAAVPGLRELDTAVVRMRQAQRQLEHATRGAASERLAAAVARLRQVQSPETPAQPAQPEAAQSEAVRPEETRPPRAADPAVSSDSRPPAENAWSEALAEVKTELALLQQAEDQRALAAQSGSEALELLDRAGEELGRVLNFDRFRYTLRPLAEDKTVSITLFDFDGIKSRQPIELALAVAADEAPRLAVRLDGISSAITPQARLPVRGKITDDHGIDRIWYEYAVDEADSGDQAVASPGSAATEVQLDSALEARDLDLAPGQKLLVTLKAADRYNLGQGPNVGSSDRWLLDVVTPQQLRTMLEAREVVLRQRFESILDDVAEMSQSLDRIDFGAEPETDPQADAEADDRSASPPSSEPGDRPSGKAEDSPQRRLALRSLRVQRALQNSRKDTHETLGVARAFDDIREELVNNRVYTEELRIRIEDQITAPLGSIVEEMFPELDRRLDALESALDDPAAGPENRDLARRQSDAILEAMRQVLDRMVDLEDFNEVVELLRSIIASQEQLRERTAEQRKQKLRALLED